MTDAERLRNVDTCLLLRLFDAHYRDGEPWPVLSRVYESRTGRYIAPFRLSTLSRHAKDASSRVLVDETPEYEDGSIERVESHFSQKYAKNAKKSQKYSKIRNFVKKSAIFATFLHQAAFFWQKIVMKAVEGVAAWKNA